MKKAPIPDNEADRLKFITELGILDSVGEQVFDDLAILASQICDCPIAVISIIDEECIWFKSEIGMGIQESPRATSFCTHAIAQNSLFVVENALEDPLFSNIPMVTGEAHIRFYAGMPIRVNNAFNIGALVVSDTKPRQLSEVQRDALKRLTRQVVSLIESKAKEIKIKTLNKSLTQERDWFKTLTDSIPAAVCYWDKNLICQFVNPAYLHKIRKNLDDVLGFHHDVVITGKTAEVTSQYIPLALAGEPCEFELTQEFLDENGEERIGLCKYAPHISQSNEVLGFFVLVTEITSIKKAEQTEQLFAHIFNQPLAGMMITDQQHNIISINQALLNMFGYEHPREVIGKHPSILAAGEDTGIEIVEQLESVGKYQGSKWGKKKNGELIYTLITIESVNDQLNNTRFFVTTVFEQTDNLKAKANLQTAKHMLERTGRLARIGGWELDLNSDQLLWTDELFNLLEVDSRIVPNVEDALRFYEPEAKSIVEYALDNCIKSGTPYDLEVPVITAKNNHIWVRTTGELIQNAGVAVKVAGTFQDITARKEEEHHRIQAEADHRNALIQEVHHRIKNNLQGISGILSNFATRNPNMAEAFNETNAQLQSVAIIYGLQGKSGENRIELGQLVDAIAQNVASLWNTNIKLTIAEDWKPAKLSEKETVPLALVINELMTNAIKHQTLPDSVEISLKFQSIVSQTNTALNNKAIITICNHGQYKPKEQDQHKISASATNNTGLNLIPSLLPRNGAYLCWYFKENKVSVSLELNYPVVIFN